MDVTIMKEEVCFAYRALDTGATVYLASMGKHLGLSGGRGARENVGESLDCGFFFLFFLQEIF